MTFNKVKYKYLLFGLNNTGYKFIIVIFKFILIFKYNRVYYKMLKKKSIPGVKGFNKVKYGSKFKHDSPLISPSTRQSSKTTKTSTSPKISPKTSTSSKRTPTPSKRTPTPPITSSKSPLKSPLKTSASPKTSINFTKVIFIHGIGCTSLFRGNKNICNYDISKNLDCCNKSNVKFNGKNKYINALTEAFMYKDIFKSLFKLPLNHTKFIYKMKEIIDTELVNNPDIGVTIAGHSYGGSVVNRLAEHYSQTEDKNRHRLRFISFGSTYISEPSKVKTLI